MYDIPVAEGSTNQGRKQREHHGIASLTSIQELGEVSTKLFVAPLSSTFAVVPPSCVVLELQARAMASARDTSDNAAALPLANQSHLVQRMAG
jgi:hypothetical protein